MYQQSRGQDAQLADTAAPVSQARPSDELLPFLNNFHDIFTTIGVLILFTGLGLGAGQLYQSIAPEEGGFSQEALILSLLFGVGLVAFVLSAILVGRQRRILPGIVLSLVFVGCISVVLIWLYTRLTIALNGGQSLEPAFDVLGEIEEPTRAAFQAALGELSIVVRVFPVIAGLIVSAVIAFYYSRFRLPFSAGLLGVALATTAAALLAIIDPYSFVIWNPTVSLSLGLALFAAGIVFDARDPERTTRLSGAGFWFHFFAAPTLLGAAVTIANLGWTYSEADFEAGQAAGLMGAWIIGDEAAAMRSAVATLIVIGAFALVSLLINRRALIVAGLITAGIATAALVSQLGLGVGTVIAVTLLLLGGVVVLLGAAWNPVRSILVAPFPRSGPLARIIPPVNHEG
ncbi:MAG: hypothetical protein AAFX09_00515 [Pseudomonadota bacterium]